MSSLIYLGLSVLAFIITYGVVFLVAAAVLGETFSVLDVIKGNITVPAWLNMYNRLEIEMQFLIPLAAGLGMFMLVLKVLMSSSVRGRD